MLEINDLQPVIKENIDSVRNSLLDTLGKSDVEKELITSINTLKNSSADEIFSSLMNKCIQFGIKVIAALLIYIVGVLLIRFVSKALKRMFERKHTEKAIVTFTVSFVNAILWILLLVIAIGALGIETMSLAALLAAGGMAIGMALSGTVQNIAGGIMILVFKPFKIGDYIEAQGHSGTVSEVNITSTKIVTTDNRVVILPNGPLEGSVVNNFSKMEYRRVDFTITVEYGSDSEKVKAVLLDIAAADDRVLGTAQGAPADAFTALSKLGESGIDFVLRLWVKAGDYWDVFFGINEKIYNILPDKGILFPFNQMSIHIEKD